MNVELELSGMSCNHCKMAVANALEDIDGLATESVEVGRAVISTDHWEDIAQTVLAAIEEEGFQVVLVNETT